MLKNSLSIKMQILISVFTLILCIFGIVILIFNFAVSMYIKNIAEGQLSYINAERQKITFVDDENITEVQESIENMRPFISRIRTQVETFILKADYTFTVDKVPEESVLIVQKIKERGLDLNNINALRIKTESGVYYISTNAVENTDGIYLCYYIDVTNLTNFAAMINELLMFIVVVAMLVSTIIVVFLSERITKPVTQLKHLAIELKEGNFAKAQEELNLRRTELKEFEDSINKAARQLEIYDKDQKAFFQNASHELRTPLMSIKCYAEGLQYGVMDKDKVVTTILRRSGQNERNDRGFALCI